MDRRSLAALAAAAVLAGCPQDKAPPAPTVAKFLHSSALHGTGTGGEVFVLADRSGLCAEIEAHPCTFSSADGAVMMLDTDAATAGRYTVPDTGGAYFVTYAGHQAVSSAGEATGGTITLDAEGQDGAIHGLYDLSFASESGSGEFTAEACAAFDAYLQAPASCSSSWIPTQYSETCTCQQQTTIRSCTRPADGTTWSCTCTASSGAQTSCSVADEQGEPATDCCPFGFE